MATACTYCGHDLPRDDAHYCNNCGMLVPSHPFSAQSLSAANNSVTPSTHKEAEKPILREQMVHQPTANPALREQMVHRPAEKPVLREQMVQQPRQRTTRRIAPDDLSASPIAWPAPMTHVSVKEALAQKDDKQAAVPESRPGQDALLHSVLPERELHVKVWEQNNPPTPLPESTVDSVEGDIEDAPTSPLETPERLDGENSSQRESSDTTRNEIEQLDTVPMPNYAQTQMPQQASHSPSSMHGNTPLPTLPIESPQQRQQSHANTPVLNSSLPPGAQSPRYSTVQRGKPLSVPLAQEKRVASTSGASRHQKSRVPFIILLALLGILVLGGGAWVVLAQPFSISPVTQPLQDFKDTGLGVALAYPNSWTVQHTSTGVLFADSSHTAQVKLLVANDASDPASYVQQQAKKSGMTAIKPLGTTSFAGLSWQQVQGNVQQDGANYTTTMFATMHGNHMYVLTQMAPQNVYADEESVVFSAMRNSFKFL